MNKQISLYTQNGDNVIPIGYGPGILNWLYPKTSFKYPFLKRLSFYWRKYHIEPKIRDKYINSICNAIDIGFNLIDYSAAYGNGDLIGEAIRKCRKKREQLYITTRVSNHAQRTHEIREELFRFLNDIKCDYVDLLQIHWPLPDFYIETWKEMEGLLKEGYVKHLGIANFHQHHFKKLIENCDVIPEVAQFEIHPLFTQKTLLHFYQQQGIIVQSYTPVARYDDRLIRLPLLKKLENKYDKSIIQIILRWHIQNGAIPLVRSHSKAHQREDFDIFDFSIDNADMINIDNLNINSRLRFDPDNCDFSIL